jgi:hypothetical protein
MSYQETSQSLSAIISGNESLYSGSGFLGFVIASAARRARRRAYKQKHPTREGLARVG